MADDFEIQLAVDDLETPALTKAQLADMLFEQIGLNKRESKDMVDAFLTSLLNVWCKVRTSKFQVLATFKFAPKHHGQAATRAPAS